MELAEAKTVLARLVHVTTQSEAATKVARSVFQISRKRLGEDERKLQLMNGELDAGQKQSAGSTKVAEKSLCQQTEVSEQVQL